MCRGLAILRSNACLLIVILLLCIRGVSSYQYDPKMVRKTEVGRAHASIGITSSVMTKRVIKLSAHLCNRSAVTSKANC
jgi:hypothetical protein